MCFFLGLPFRKFIQRRQKMRKYLVAAVLIGAFATPALAVESGGGKYFVGLDTTSHKMLGRDRDGPGHENDGRV